MIPELSENDMKMFYQYLYKETVYFEYGSGVQHIRLIWDQTSKKFILLRATKIDWINWIP